MVPYVILQILELLGKTRVSDAGDLTVFCCEPRSCSRAIWRQLSHIQALRYDGDAHPLRIGSALRRVQWHATSALLSLVLAAASMLL